MRQSTLRRYLLVLMGGGASDYYQKVMATNPIAYWRLNETEGTAADDLRSAINGVYTNVTLNNTIFVNGDPAPLFVQASSSRVTWAATPLPSLDVPEGSLMVWARVTHSTWADGTTGYICKFQVDGNNYFSVIKESNLSILMCYYVAGGIVDGLSHYTDYTDWMYIVITWSKANERARLYFNKDLVIAATTLGVWGAGDVHPTYTGIGVQTSTALYPFQGNICSVAIWDKELQQSDIDYLWLEEFPTAKKLLVMGDSKTWNNWWVENLCNALTIADSTKWIELTPRQFAVGGWDVDNLEAYVTANLASVTDTPDAILINIGTNDARPITITDELDFKSDLTSVIDQLIAKWSGVPIYVNRIWRGDSAQTITNSGLISGYIDDVIATYATGVNAGTNEPVWVEAGDGGVTMLQADLVHYSNTGQGEAVTQWLAVMGFTL